MLNRRDALNLGATAAASVLASTSGGFAREHDDSLRLVDTNISLFHWPFRRLPLDELVRLLKRLRTLGVDQAWAGSFEAVLHRDMAGVNRRLAEACKNHNELVPIGSVNLELPDWEEDLRRCFDEHQMPGVRLHPNYHAYTLNDPRFVKLLKVATAAKRMVQIAALIEDTRTQHPSLQTPDVELMPLLDLMPSIPGAIVQILNYRPRGAVLERLAKTPGIYLDTARVEGTDGVPTLVEKLPPGRVLFGTHAPFLIPEAAMIRVHESGRLDAESLQALMSQNARAVLGRISP